MCSRRKSWDDFARVFKFVPNKNDCGIDEIQFGKYLKDDTPLAPQMHTAYRSVLGQINWVQSRSTSPTSEDWPLRGLRSWVKMEIAQADVGELLQLFDSVDMHVCSYMLRHLHGPYKCTFIRTFKL